VPILLNKKDNFSSHLGTRSRNKKNPKSRNDHQQNVEAWKQHLEEQAVLQQQPSSGITAGLQAANMLGQTEAFSSLLLCS
jgi:hypothetical protein